MMRLDQYHPAHLCMTDVVWEVYCPQDVQSEADAIIEFKLKVNEGFYDSTSLGKDTAGLSTQDYIDSLKAAHSDGLVTDQELHEELEWLSQEVEDGHF